MILAVDTHYDESSGVARAASVLFDDWTSADAESEATRGVDSFEEYRPGHFFRRELPCILPLIHAARASALLSVVVVDGYVDLGGGKAGLGRHVHEALDRAVEVVGVAKSEFLGAPSVQVLRGDSARPLYVSSTGDVDSAARAVRSMAGAYRIPDLLRRVDQLSRG